MATKAREWKNKNKHIELELPSENTALVRRLTPEAFLSSGMIPDHLSEMVHTAIRTKKGLPPDAVKKIAGNPEELAKVLQLMDEVLCYVVVEPSVSMPPRCGVTLPSQPGVICNEYVDTADKRHKDNTHADYHIFMEDARNPDTLYADEVSFEDKNFIFQFALGGTADVERFREEQRKNVANVSNGKAVQHKTKRAARRK